MKVLSWAFVACLSLGLCASGEALAQAKGGGKGAPSKSAAAPKEPTPKDKAAVFAKEGAQSEKAGEWDDAYANYAIAWSIDPSWEIAGPLGKAAYKTKHYAESVQRLQFFLTNAPAAKISAKERTEAEAFVQDAKSKTGLIVVKGPPGGEVQIDGTDAGKTPLAEPIVADPGQHKIEVKNGAQGETRTAEVVAGKTVELDFTPKPAAPKTVIVKEEGVFTPQVRTAAVIGGGALALGGLAAGGALMGVSVVKGDERAKAQLDPYGLDAAKAAAIAEADMRSAAIWCFVGGGAAAIGTGVFYLVTRPKVKEPAPIKAGAMVGPQGPSVWVQGQF